jgi:tripartite-type tricarboxylate transporter receptor subunit TctC
MTKSVLATTCSVALLCASSVIATAQAQQYPVKPIRILVGFSAGSGTDGAARMIGQKLAESFGQQTIVENRPGAGGMIATEAVSKAAPDGYSLRMPYSPPYARKCLTTCRAISPLCRSSAAEFFCSPCTRRCRRKR